MRSIVGMACKLWHVLLGLAIEMLKNSGAEVPATVPQVEPSSKEKSCWSAQDSRTLKALFIYSHFVHLSWEVD